MAFPKATYDEQSGLWKLVDKNGYVRLYSEEPTPRNYTKFEYEHRKSMENEVKRKLLLAEIIHHIDGNRSNNDIKNLKLVKDHLEHIRMEHPNWRRGKNKEILNEAETAASLENDGSGNLVDPTTGRILFNGGVDVVEAGLKNLVKGASLRETFVQDVISAVVRKLS